MATNVVYAQHVTALTSMQLCSEALRAGLQCEQAGAFACMQAVPLPWSRALCSAVAAAMAIMADLQTGVVDRPPLIKVLLHLCTSNHNDKRSIISR